MKVEEQVYKIKSVNFLIIGSLRHPYELLARSPDDSQRIRVASVFELFFVLCLFDCLSVLGKFSNFSSPHPPLL